MSFVSEKRKCIPIFNGNANVFNLDDYGLSISVGKDCLPPNVKECSLFVTADLTTDIPLPSGSFLVSAVYHITTTPFIERFNQPVEVSMIHCAKDSSQLCFMVAKDQAQSRFEYMNGGTFEVDARTGMKIGRIHISSFSFLTTVWNWVTGSVPNVSYSGLLYYDDSQSQCRKVHFVITKNLPLANEVRV